MMPEPSRSTTYLLPVRGERNGRRKQVIGYVGVEDDDFSREVLAKMSWHLCKGYPATCVRRPDGSYAKVYLHRLVSNHYHGEIPPGREVDHRDREKKNNRPDNLRAETRSVNSANKGLTRRNQSGYQGVSWNKSRGAWVANVRKDGHLRHFGAYPTPEEAARAVNAAYRVLFPEVSIPNPGAEMPDNADQDAQEGAVSKPG